MMEPKRHKFKVLSKPWFAAIVVSDMVSLPFAQECVVFSSVGFKGNLSLLELFLPDG